MIPRLLLVSVAALAVGASRFLARAPSPDDWDALGFTLALERYDLAALTPHPPGYPVYVALCRLLHLALPSAHDAAVLASSLAAAVTAAALFHLGVALRGPRAGWLALGLYAAASLPWVAGASAWSDGTAAALLTVAAALLVARRPLSSGVAIGLLLGTRLSCLPLGLSWAVVVAAWRREALGRAFAGAGLGVLLWLPALLAVVGPRALVAASLLHAAGHFTLFGGSVATEPDLAPRAFGFARALLWDGLAPSLLSLSLLAATLGAALSLPAARAVLSASWRVVAVVALPYAAWALLGQNVIAQPRHLLPLVLLLVLLAALVLDGARLLGGLAVAALLAGSLPVAVLHHRTEAPAAQLARHVAARAAERGAPSRILFGGRSTRFVQWMAPSVKVIPRQLHAEVDVDLERLDRLPAEVLVTSELELDPRRAPRLRPGPTFCRDQRLERRQPCIQLFTYDLLGPLLPREREAR